MKTASLSILLSSAAFLSLSSCAKKAAEELPPAPVDPTFPTAPSPSPSPSPMPSPSPAPAQDPIPTQPTTANSPSSDFQWNHNQLANDGTAFSNKVIPCPAANQKLYSIQDCQKITVEKGSLSDGRGKAKFDEEMFVGESYSFSYTIRPLAEYMGRLAGVEDEISKSGTIVGGFKIGNSMRLTLNGKPNFSTIADGERHLNVKNKNTVIEEMPNNRVKEFRWTVIPQKVGQEQILSLSIINVVHTSQGEYEINPELNTYKIAVKVREKPLWDRWVEGLKKILNDITGLVGVTNDLVSQLGLLLAAIGALGAAYWAMRRDWHRP